MWIIDRFKEAFTKKNFALPLSDKRPMIAVIQGKIAYFESTDEKKIDAWLIDKYNKLSEVSAPVNKFAEYASIVEPELFDKNGKELPETHPAHLLINNPNKNQNWEEFYKKHIIYRLLLGQSYINAYGYISPRLAFELKLLPPQYTSILIKNRIDWRNLEIDYYSVKVPDWNEIQITDLETVLHVKNTSPNFGRNADLYGISKLMGCVKNIESIESGYGAKVGLYRNGPRIIITGKTVGEFASANAQSNESVREVQDRINSEYGLQENQYSVMITDIPLDVNVVSMNMGELKINENNIADFQNICRALDIDSRILSDMSTSAMNNFEMAIDAFLNGSFKILVENDYGQWSEWLSTLFKEKIEMKPNYEKIPAIVKKENENNDMLILMAEKGLLTRNEVLERIGEEPSTDPDFNEYYTYYQGVWSELDTSLNDETEQDTEQITGEDTEQNINTQQDGTDETT